MERFEKRVEMASPDRIGAGQGPRDMGVRAGRSASLVSVLTTTATSADRAGGFVDAESAGTLEGR